MSHLQILRYPQDISSALLGKQLLALEIWPGRPARTTPKSSP